MRNPFHEAYLVGLKGYIVAVENVDLSDPAQVKSMLRHGVDHFGLKRLDLAAKVGADKTTITKWLNEPGMTRGLERNLRLIQSWILSETRQQLA